MNSQVITQVIILFLIIFVGIYARKRNFINKTINDGLSRLLINVTLPLMVFNSFTSKISRDMIANAEKIFIYAVIIHAAIIIFSKIAYFKTSKEQRGVAKFVTLFSNSGFMGYPILNGLYGNVGVFYCAIFGIVFNVFMFTYGIMVLKEENDKNFLSQLKKIISNPVIISMIAGMLVFLFNIKLPYVLSTAISSVGSITPPLSMIIVGSMLAGTDIKSAVSGKNVYILSFIRLLAMPIFSWLILKALGAPSLIIDIIVLLEAMPAASNVAMLTIEYGGDELLSVKSIFVSTVLSMISIPIIIKFLL
ncbi:AEC family transporter [Clostridium sp. 19966]|uniref:AEC family transporter n=1 Tax=Clostridium sp. 19966 TaxID=2768166 RepID=UPI0028E04CC5|nr:AEC family transporter [Clostridium sp. 19966]MDT8717959.1 AEC family transporter [Clostridium sp. 19966]